MSLDFYLEEERTSQEEVFWANITHNLTKMADKAGIYQCLWRPSELTNDGKTKAKDIVELLREGLKKLKENPEYYRQFDSPNGWGIYDHFVPFVEKCLIACEENPNADVRVSV